MPKKRKSVETQLLVRRIKRRKLLQQNPELAEKIRLQQMEARRRRRANMTEEEKTKQREYNNERKRKRRLQQAQVRRKEIMDAPSTSVGKRKRTDQERAKDAQRKREYRAALSPEKRQELRARDAERKRKLRARQRSVPPKKRKIAVAKQRAYKAQQQVEATAQPKPRPEAVLKPKVNTGNRRSKIIFTVPEKPKTRQKNKP